MACLHLFGFVLIRAKQSFPGLFGRSLACWVSLLQLKHGSGAPCSHFSSRRIWSTKRSRGLGICSLTDRRWQSGPFLEFLEWSSAQPNKSLDAEDFFFLWYNAINNHPNAEVMQALRSKLVRVVLIRAQRQEQAILKTVWRVPGVCTAKPKSRARLIVTVYILLILCRYLS